MQVIESGTLPVYSWAPDLEPGALQQALHCAQLPVAHHHVAVMADGHQGYGVPIGAVLAVKDAISPYAAGNDIGCGMAIVPTTLAVEDFLSPLATKAGVSGPVARDEVMGRAQAAIPSGSDSHRHPIVDPSVDALLHAAFDALEEASTLTGLRLSTTNSPDSDKGELLTREGFVHRGRSQAGTLGSGNHFIEMLESPDGKVWVMLHSGSRGVGSMVCNNFHRMALRSAAESGHRLPDPGLAWLPVGDGEDRWERVGRCYERALRASLDYAERNRRRMLETLAGVLGRHFGDVMTWDEMVNIHHNDATPEDHYGQTVWVHRKGAVKATPETPTITPGSMGTGTYIGRGLGKPESFSSCSHGAGRVMSRAEARRALSLQQQLESVRQAGGKVFARNKEAVLDEMPGAYKDLDDVMANQADLVEPVMHLTPLATYKGADRPRRKKGSRPEEER